jgi:tyrosinase
VDSVVTNRKEVTQLTPDDLAALRDAYGKMMAISTTDNRSWIYWAGYHGFPNWYCWHHGRLGMGSQQPVNLFLPWHRAYLLYFEHVARDQNDKASLPWWDWTSQNSHEVGIPAEFSTSHVDGQANPLFSGPVPPIQDDPARQTARFPGDPSALPSADDVTALLSLSSFEDFTSQLEDIHDMIHGWVGGMNPNPPPQGGDMGSIAVAAFDPIFWSHHCMIDRIWYLWQLQNGVNNIPQEYLSMTLGPFNLAVSDVLNIGNLGYEYAVAEASVEVAAG